MPYQIVYHPAVLEDDLPVIARNIQARIQRAIAQRLAVEPTRYGEPLRFRLKGYWKLRVGDYRVIYQVTDQEVWVFRIWHRKNVYDLPIQRFLWRPS